MTAKPMTAKEYMERDGTFRTDCEWMEEYAAYRVRVALEEAAQLTKQYEPSYGFTMRRLAEEIRALMPEGKP